MSEDASLARRGRIRAGATRAQLKIDASQAARQGQGKFRQALIKQEGMTKQSAQPYDAHHMLPVKNAWQFSRAGINVNEPRYGRLVERSHHQAIGYAWTQSWNRFWLAHDDFASKELIERHLHNIARGIMGVQWA